MDLFKHQDATAQFVLDERRTWVQSDPGTGKTISLIEAFLRHRRTGGKGRMLVVAPLSILQPSWGNDIEKWAGDELTYSIAYAKNRREAFLSDADIIITNHDAVKWMVDNWATMRAVFDEAQENWLVIDEATAYKNPTSQRSKAMLQVRSLFAYRTAMSGTPNSNSVLDLFHPTLIVDDGMHLGNKFFQFRAKVTDPVQVGPDPRHLKWVDKPDAVEEVAMALADMTIRYRLEDCIDIPENTVITYTVDLPPKLMKQYEELKETSMLEHADGPINSVHAGARVKKLLQLLTGAVYDAQGEARLIHTTRYELVMELVQEREQCVVAFNWKHEREQLVKLAEKMGIPYGVIDGTVTSPQKRTQIVEDFQAGKLKVIFAHPQSAGHGLTLTAGTTTIWASPTYNAEHYDQFNHRIYRAGQTKRTTTIHIAARDTEEELVYEKLQGKMGKMIDLLALMAAGVGHG